MTDLINKIERRLGTQPLNLPDNLKKEKWAENVIIPDTITTFSRFFPYKIPVMVDSTCKKDGYYFIDKDLPEDIEILGVRDINWKTFARDSIRIQQGVGYGIYDFLSHNYGMDDIALLQMRADNTSLFNNGIYIDFIPPNMIKLETVNGGVVIAGAGEYVPATVTLAEVSGLPEIFIKHQSNLMTIEPTKMETFERLAIADVATYLFQYLKHYDGLETVYANIDLKLSYLENEANKRDDVVQYLNDSYVNPSNSAQPIMYTV